MRHLTLLCLAILLPAVAYAQTATVSRTAADNPARLSDSNQIDYSQVYRSPEAMPAYPGGTDALLAFLCDNLTYPEEAEKNNIEGRVIVQFIVEIDGSVSETKVVRSVSKDLDAEAVRVCRLLSGFTPGYLNGEPVRVWYTLPITFKIPAENHNPPQ